MNRDVRINMVKPLELELKIERKSKEAGAKWSTKQVTLDGFINPPEASAEPDKLTINGVVTGEVEFKIDFEFTDDGVLMKAAFGATPKDAEDADYRMSIISDLKDMYSMSATATDEEKDIKGKTRGCEMRIETRKSKPEKIRFYEPIEVERLHKEEIVALELKSEKVGRKKIYWSLANPKVGSIMLEPDADSKMPYRGFKLSTLIVDETGKKHGEGILLEYK